MKKFFALLAVAVLVAFAAPAFAANPFVDVPMNHWSYDALSRLAAKGVVQGYPDGSFKGNQPMTRYEMATVVARALATVDMDKASKEDVEMLKRLVVEFKDELDALGVKVDELDERVAVLEKNLGGWRFYGELRFTGEWADEEGQYSNVVGDTEFDLDRYRLWMTRKVDDKLTMIMRLGDDGRTSDGTAWERYYAEVMFPWDFKVWVGKWNFDWEADDKIIYAQESWFTDQTYKGFHAKKSWGNGYFAAFVAHQEKDENRYYYADGGKFESNLPPALQALLPREIRVPSSFGVLAPSGDGYYTTPISGLDPGWVKSTAAGDYQVNTKQITEDMTGYPFLQNMTGGSITVPKEYLKYNDVTDTYDLVIPESRVKLAADSDGDGNPDYDVDFSDLLNGNVGKFYDSRLGDAYIYGARFNFNFNDRFRFALSGIMKSPDEDYFAGLDGMQNVEQLVYWADFTLKFTPGFSLIGAYYWEDLDEVPAANTITVPGREKSLIPVTKTEDSPSAYKVVLNVDQSVLKFTSIWAEYAHFDEGWQFFTFDDSYGTTPHSAYDYHFDGSGVYLPLTFYVGAFEADVFRAYLYQKWSDKWGSFISYTDVSYDGTGAYQLDTEHWAVGFDYWYTPAVKFTLSYEDASFDDDHKYKDDSLLRFRTWIFF